MGDIRQTEEKSRSHPFMRALISFPIALSLSALAVIGATTGEEGAWLAWIAWLPWLARLEYGSASWQKSSLEGWLLGGLWYGFLFFWMPGALQTHAGLPVLDAWLWWLGASLLLGSAWANLGGWSALLKSKGIAPRWSFPILWVIQSWGLEYFPFGGIPWGSLAATQPLTGWQESWIRHFGGAGLEWLMGLSAVWLLGRCYQRQFFQAGAGLLLLLAVAERPELFGRTAPKQVASSIPVLLVPHEVALSDLQDQTQWPHLLNRAVELSQAPSASPPPRWIIWPESAYPGVIERGTTLVQLFETLQPRGVNLILGSNAEPRFPGLSPVPLFNAAYWLRTDFFEFQHYAKQHLIPYAEFHPTWGGLPKATPQLPDYTPGQTLGVWQAPETKLGIAICFETIFAPLIREQVQNGAEWLVGISNSQWLDSHAQEWHGRLSRLRALEVGRDAVLVSNGAGARHFRPGQSWADSPRQSRPLVVEVQPREESTLYARGGPWPLLGLMGGYLGLGWLINRSGKKSRDPANQIRRPLLP